MQSQGSKDTSAVGLQLDPTLPAMSSSQARLSPFCGLVHLLVQCQIAATCRSNSVCADDGTCVDGLRSDASTERLALAECLPQSIQRCTETADPAQAWGSTRTCACIF